MSEANHRFVVRLARDRTAREDESAVEERVSALTTRTELVFDVQVQLSTRPEKATLPRKSLMPRDARKARLAISTTRMQIKKPPYVRDAPPWLDLNVVCVREIDVPDGMHPVEWTLLTTEPVDTLEQVCAIVEYYRARWLIEELFKAIKTGCEYEKLQLESYDALVNALAMFLPIAWRMLLLRNLERSEPGAPAALVVSPDELEVLRIFGPTLSQSPSVRDVLLAVASLGGYIKHKIRPGWLVLARGFEKLTLLQRGFAAARR
jgi:IS4 transposase